MLLTVAFERIAFYGIVGNLVLFLNMDPLDWKSYNASSILFMFTGFAYIFALLGGWIADSLLGKFKTIMIFMFVYIIGYSFMPALGFGQSQNQTLSEMWCSFDTNQTSSAGGNSSHTHLREEGCSVVVISALTIMAVAIGVVKANIAPFGADQVSKALS